MKKELQELPYTVVGHTSLPRKFSILLTGEGLKEIVSQMQENDKLIITIANKKRPKFEIVVGVNPPPRKEPANVSI